MSSPLIHLKDIAHGFGGKRLLDGAELAVGKGDRLCLVGRNGSGKSTLLKIAAGLLEPDRGERYAHPSATVQYLAQEPDLTAWPTAGDYVLGGLGEGGDPHAAAQLLADLGLTGEESTANLSGGEARRAALARVMAAEPDILLLDEPTNHLDLPAIEWLESALGRLKSGLVVISHDRRFLSALSRATLWVDRGQVRRMEKGFADFEAWRDDILEQEERDAQKLARKIAAEEHWLRYGVTARRKRNVRRLGLLQELRSKARTRSGPVGNVTLTATEAQESGKLVIEASAIGKAFGGAPVVHNLSMRIARGARLGIVGPNGSGKTTLINLLTGALAPDEGSVRIGVSVALATLDQKRESVDPDFTLKQAMTDDRGDIVEVGGQPRHVMGYLKDFLFSPEQANTPISVLSGGERGRMMLARALARPANLLVLDEPTNDLDLETLDLLQELLADYPGTLILVSHDRDFLDRVCTSILMSEGRGRWIEYAGGYSDMIAQRGAGVDRRPQAVTRAAGAKPGAAAPEAPSARRMTFKDRHLLETLPGLMEAVARDIAKLETALAEPGLYSRDRARYDKAAALLAELQRRQTENEETWLRLEMLREETEG
ncbi:MAG: ABC-F family ATP-binding cassette domain-containing protein [Methylocystis sp.]|nr:ABC-F family ATP-binding cassette domain-containing protein [Methylocystis sp.]MCA3583294.1 ABC-F family ATP-binding cassette domain-containing protein [Methylocystis sp.]MCA3588079.1 ABC-F family ATP-binding cassette domain-containing protein [Methylocystis sp.]MCA3591479.1 ABC-F family ATP-binding cassette domain-containing protein [Methylocystis sp.]